MVVCLHRAAWLRCLTQPRKSRRPLHQGRLAPEQLEDRFAPAGVTFTYGVNEVWNNVFEAHITITNTSATSITDWKLGFNDAATITDMWNGSVVASSGGHDTVDNAGYNSTIAKGASVTLGFIADGNSKPGPSAFVLSDAILPTLSVNNVATTQDGASTLATFTITLSTPSAAAVTVNYATADGTGVADVNYTAASGTATINAGQKSTTVSVVVLGTPTWSPPTTFTLDLSDPSGANLKTATGTATIRDSRPEPTPSISVSAATGVEGSTTSNSGNSTADFFHTSGNQIVDAYGNDVRIASVALFGLEQGIFSIDGLGPAASGEDPSFDGRSLLSMLQQIKQLGFNTIRLPFSNQLIDDNGIPTTINYKLNPDLVGLTGLQVMDKVIADCGTVGLRVILDDHHTTINGPNATGLWYAGNPDPNWASDSTFISDWVMLAKRYANNPTVIGADLFNEPEGDATWGSGDPATDWRLAAEAAGDAIQQYSPHWLIIVEGIQYTSAGADWWGGNLSEAGAYPVQLTLADQVVYSPHDYSKDVSGGQSWFNAPDYPSNLPGIWYQFWGYLYYNNIAPVWLGEFGTSLSDADNPNAADAQSDQEWITALTHYLQDPVNAAGVPYTLAPGQQGISWSYWAFAPDSADVGGILESDWTTANPSKMAFLTPLESTFPTNGTTGSGTQLTFDVSLSVASTKAVTVNYATSNGTALAGVEYRATHGTLTFAPGVTTKMVTIPLLDDKTMTADDTLNFTLSAPVHATLAVAKAIGTIEPPADSSDASGGTSGGTTPPDVTVTTEVTQTWGSVFNENVTITNTGTMPLTNWVLDFSVPFTITTLWEGTLVSHTGTTYEVDAASYNATIAPGASVTFGFTADGDDKDVLSKLELNGVPLAS